MTADDPAGVRVGLAFVAGGMIAACLSAFASIPLLPNFGVWFQAEPVILALFASATICALGLALLAYRAPMIVWNALWHPLVAIPVLVSLWSWAAPTALGGMDLPFFGTPQLGLGGAWFLSLAIMTAGARCLLSLPNQTRRLAGFVLTMISITLCVVIANSLALGDWRPYNFGDYLAFHGLYIWIITACWLPQIKWLRWGGLLIGLIIILISKNLTASIAFFAAILSIFVIMYLERFWTGTTLRRVTALGIGVVAILTPVGIYYAHRIGFPDFVSFETVATFKSRSLLLDTVLSTIMRVPENLLTGFGWGSLSESIYMQIPLDQTTVVSPSAMQSRDLFFWDGLWMGHFHTHNEMAEHLYSGGVPSAVLWLGYLIALPLTAAKGNLRAVVGFSVGYVLLSSMWFQMPGGLPLMAMAVAGLGAGKPPPAKKPAVNFATRSKLSLTLPMALPAIAFVIMASTSTMSYVYGSASAKQVERNFIPAPASAPPLCGLNSPVLGPSLTHFSELMKVFAMGNIEMLREGEQLETWRYARMDDYLCRADELMAQNGPLSIGVRGLTMRSDFAFAPLPLTHGTFEKRLFTGWDKNLMWVLSRAPSRTDLGAPYLSWLLAKGDEPRILQISEQMLATNPNDPVGLWFSGIVLLNDTNRVADAVQRLKRALKNDLEKIMPVEADLKIKLKAL